MSFRNWIIALAVGLLGCGRNEGPKATTPSPSNEWPKVTTPSDKVPRVTTAPSEERVIKAPVKETAIEAEERVVATIEKQGGQVERDETKPGKPVYVVQLYGQMVSEATIKEFALLRNLSVLVIDPRHVTDVGLKEIAQLKGLTKLNLDRTNVTDLGMKEIIQLKRLTRLDLNQTGVTDAGIAELQKALPKCRIER